MKTPHKSVTILDDEDLEFPLSSRSRRCRFRGAASATAATLAATVGINQERVKDRFWRKAVIPARPGSAATRDC
jgi:hypothetical protein